jgi:ceramide glucosyltransferase
MPLEDGLLSLFLIFSFLQSLAGVFDGIGHFRYVRRHLRVPVEPWTPFISVFLPCKGLDYELERNVEAVLCQDYPDYEVILVTASGSDPSVPVLESLRARYSGHKVKFVIAGISEERGEKVNNLMQAVAGASSESVLFAFVDSDCRPNSRWLRNLVSPLKDERIGACTGYRWFFPKRGNIASVLRAAWNGSVAMLLRDHDHNFAWGGSMAIRRSTFEKIRVLNYWNHSISDDYSLTQALKDAALKIHYEPRCLIPSHGDCSWRELLEWSTRQILITKLYSRSLWLLALASQFPFLIGWWWGIGRLNWGMVRFFGDGLTRSVLGGWQLGVIMSLIYFFGVVRGLLRLNTVSLIFPTHQRSLSCYWWGHTLLAPLVSTLMGYNLLVSLTTSTLEWRGVRYEVRSPDEVRVLRKAE